MPNAPLATYGDGDFLSALAHHLGAEAKLSDAILPVALFTNHLPAKQYFTISNIFSYLGYGEGGGDLVGLTSIDHPKVRIVDAVRASAAMRDLFVPHEFELNGESHIFIDAASAKLSTLEETIKIAKKIWPDEKLYVFKFGDHPMEGHIESVHESLKARYR